MGMHTTTAKAVSDSALGVMFTVVNIELEESGDSLDTDNLSRATMNDDNPDNALTRFEWIELLYRVTVARYKTVIHKVVS